MEVSTDLHSHATSKLSSLEKFIPQKESQEVLAETELGRRSHRHKTGDVYRAEINLTVDGVLHRAVAKKSDLTEAFDVAYQSVERQIRQGKKKSDSAMRRGARRAKEMLRDFRG